MNRRTFCKVSCGIAGLMVVRPDLQALTSANKQEKTVRFGMITDLHYAKRSDGSRYYAQSMLKLNEAIHTFNENKLDFIVELGDFKDQGANPARTETLTFLDEIELEFQRFSGPKYHALGNHDMDSISKTDFFAHTENSGEAKGKNYYSFIQRGVKFIVLDATFNENGSDYDNNNFDWTKAIIPDNQKTWLEEELDSEYPAVVFVHHLLDPSPEASKDHRITNAADVVEILERKNNVLAVFQGHYHEGHYSFRNGIHYFTINSVIDGAFPANNSFAIVEIDESLNISIDGFYLCEDMLLERNPTGTGQVSKSLVEVDVNHSFSIFCSISN
jgi:alkaline phosphatase